MTPGQRLAERLERADALVCVMGLGYVGLPLAGALHEAGFGVLGFDTDPAKIDALKAGREVARAPLISEVLTEHIKAAKTVTPPELGRLIPV